MNTARVVARLALVASMGGVYGCQNLPPTPLNADAWIITKEEDKGQALCSTALQNGSLLTYGSNPPTPDQPPGSDWLANGPFPGALLIDAKNNVCRFFDITVQRNESVLPDYTWKKGNVVTLAVTYPHTGAPAEKKTQSLAYFTTVVTDGQKDITFPKVIVVSGFFPEIASVSDSVRFGLWPAKAGDAQLNRTGYTAAKTCTITPGFVLTCP